MAHRVPRFDRLDDRVPHVRFLSNGNFTTAVTSAGSGYAACRGQAITNWMPDATQDGLGYFVYVRDGDDGKVWSATHQPTCVAAESTRAVATAGRVTFTRVVHGIEAKLEICVDPARDCEVRRLVLTDLAERERRIEVTTYAEIVLASLAAQHGHPAFSKLFVQTEYEASSEALLAARRPRARDDRRTWAAHRLLGEGTLEWETDRARFVGRGRNLAHPLALTTTALSGTTGNVLDPVFALRRVVPLGAGGCGRFDLLLGFGETREQALDNVALDRHAVTAAFDAAATREQELRKHAKVRDPEAERLQEFAGRALYLDPTLKPAAEPPPRAKQYLKGLGLEPRALEPGKDAPVKRASKRKPFRRLVASAEPPAQSPAPLERDNGYGGFARGGREYVVRFDGSRTARPPMPWINVMANERFGCFASESGAAYTWSENSRENRLTPWSNDPIIDPHGEALYLRDDTARTFWSPLPGPVADGGSFEVRHGFGSSTWRHESAGLDQEVVAFVPRAGSVKIVCVRLKNLEKKTRRLSLFSYHQLVLGVLPWETAPSIATEITESSRAVLAWNEKSQDFAGRVAYAVAVAPEGATLHATADRVSFLGRNGAPERPTVIVGGEDLDGRAGRGLDPCAALQMEIEVPPRATVECAFLLGQETDRESALGAIQRWRDLSAITAAREEVEVFWRDVVSAVEIETPSPAIDLMANGWLLYQCLSCRLWGRSAFFQSGGAWGFRDQLQDSAALLYTRPDLTRAQILLHAAHQFPEGDVLHWWHPPADRGTRTRCSDDLLWLPYISTFYAKSTGDFGVFDEQAGYVTARRLEDGEDETYIPTSPAGTSSDVYEHCCRSIDRSLGVGEHGLPFMGTCDWNDGMNHVGREGRGESTWMAFFLHTLLTDFAPVCERRGDAARATRYREHCEKLRAALEKAGWDGEWYRRAYDDHGEAWGSAENDECRIDVLAQAWAVISGTAPPERANQVMDAVERWLVDRQGKLIRLLTPPFDKTERDPGYIKGYVPGIRENGGQYTHAATWAVRAFAELGRRDVAARLLEMISPVTHASDRATADVYKVEPYVVCADVYGTTPHVGRGGWTWYTGSAGWLYRVTLESILGVTMHGGNELRVKPCIPDDWPRFRVRYRLPDRKTVYEIEVENPRGNTEAIKSVTIDGESGTLEERTARIPLKQDATTHQVKITF